jgi:hypothetical protein
MIDPLLSLAISIQSAPGVFAILAGSGLSRSAGIKTGWEITQDLASVARRAQIAQRIAIIQSLTPHGARRLAIPHDESHHCSGG